MNQYFIGMMSGTSMDGIDAVVVDFSTASPRVLFQHFQPYTDSLREEIYQLCQPGADISQMMQLDARLGELYSDVVETLLVRSGLCSKEIIAIGNHGQTIAHFPDSDFPTSLQLGDANRIAQRTGITTITDFRRRDMAVGGQGAPLVPAFHDYLFRHDEINRVILNIGGIANITLLPCETEKPVAGFDTGPGNTLLDHWCQRHTGKAIDESGNWARTGTVIQPLLGQMLQDQYFRRTAPKSTGTDYFNLSWCEPYFMKHTETKAEDIQATLLQLTVSSITSALLSAQPGTQELIVCGGGSRNTYLMQQLAAALPGLRVVTTGEYGYDPDYIEAIAFAWLARQAIERLPGNLPDVTGATQRVILGAIYPGN